MQTSIGAINTYTRSNQCKDKLQMANLSIPRTSGIYVIANTKNGKVYIGKGANISTRWTRHKTALRGNYHHNQHLQAAWNKYGEKSFKFLVLEYCAIEQLTEREIHHIAIYKARGLAYNLTDGGDGMLGHIPTEETRIKLSATSRGRKKPPRSAEHRAKISAAHIGKEFTPEHRARLSIAGKNRKTTPETRAKLSAAGKNISLETRTKRSAALSQKWLVIKPNGENIEVVNLKAFCRKNGLHDGSMSNVANGKQNNYKGWKCQKVVE